MVNTTHLGSYPPLPMQDATLAGNALGKSSYANVTGKPNGKKLNIRICLHREWMAYPVIANNVRNTWGKYRLVRSIFNSSIVLFSFQFSSIDGLDAINGPWFIRNHPLILKKWHPNENLFKEDVSTIPVWVKLHGVPVTAFSEDGLSDIATKLDDRFGRLLAHESSMGNWVGIPWCTPFKVFGHIHEECPKNIGAGEKKTLKKPSQTSRGNNRMTTNLVNIEATLSGSSFMNIDNSSTRATPITDKIEKFEELLTSGKATLMDEAGNPLKKVEYPDDYDSEDEVLSVNNDMARSMASERDCFIRQRIVNGSLDRDWSMPITMGRTKTEFDNLILDITSLESDEIVGSDSFIWNLSNDDTFSVNKVRKHIDERSLPLLSPSTCWYKMIPKKVNIFKWRMFLDRLPNHLNLSSRGLDLYSISCMVCNESFESNTHTFFTCDTASSVWRLVRSWTGFSFPTFCSCVDWDIWFDSWHASKDKKSRAYTIFAATCWTIWPYRNNITFNSQYMRKCDIFDFICLVYFLGLNLEELKEGDGDGVVVTVSNTKRVLVGAGARALFYPTLLYNVVRNQFQTEFRWWDRVDQFVLLGAVPFPTDVFRLKEVGVCGVVTLNESYETLVPTSLYHAHGIDHLVIPTRDYLFAPSYYDICKAVEFIHRNASAGKTTYVHCKAGRGRSTTIVLCYLVKYKQMTPVAAYEYVKSIRPRVRLASSQWRAVQDYYYRERVKKPSNFEPFDDAAVVLVSESDLEGYTESYDSDFLACGFDAMKLFRKSQQRTWQPLNRWEEMLASISVFTKP
nr:putative dual specificity protein phosphatase DSP8 [Tanacetum cinerariifolium]